MGIISFLSIKNTPSKVFTKSIVYYLIYEITIHLLSLRL